VDDWGGLENRCGLRATVGSNPTLSAERTIWTKSIGFRQSHTGSRSVEKRMSKNGIFRLGVGHTSMLATPEIAQCPLGDLNY
jgi:hypothetical protein